MSNHHAISPWLTALVMALLVVADAGCGAKQPTRALATGKGESAAGQGAVPTDAYPQAPMAVVASAEEEGRYRLVVCATGEGTGERSPWIASVTLVDLGEEPPVIAWEVVLPSGRRDDAWDWQPGVPWTATLGRAPAGFDEPTALAEPLEPGRLYQVSVTGWDPGELLFFIDPDSGAPIHLDAAGNPLPEPRLPCWGGY